MRKYVLHSTWRVLSLPILRDFCSPQSRMKAKYLLDIGLHYSSSETFLLNLQLNKRIHFKDKKYLLLPRLSHLRMC